MACAILPSRFSAWPARLAKSLSWDAIVIGASCSAPKAAALMGHGDLSLAKVNAYAMTAYACLEGALLVRATLSTARDGKPMAAGGPGIWASLNFIGPVALIIPLGSDGSTAAQMAGHWIGALFA